MLFTAGLLHDIGRFLMVNRAPDLMMAAEEYMTRNQVSIVDAERIRVGVTHIETGELLLRQWKLPTVMIDCLRCHHSAEHSIASTYLVYLANYLSSQVIPSNDVEVREVLSGVTLSDRFRISPNHIVRSCRTAEETAFEVMDALGMVTFDNSEAVYATVFIQISV